MDDRERRLAEQMADRLRDLIKEYESLERPAPEWVSASWLSFVVYWRTLKTRCNSGVEFRDWNGWSRRFPISPAAN
jgi:hypothetical protein